MSDATIRDEVVTQLLETIADLAGIGEAPPPPPSPPPTSPFGGLLSPRMAPSPGPVVNCAGMTAAQLQSTLSSCALGSILDGGGTTFNRGSLINLTWNRVGDAAHVTTLQNCKFQDTRVLVLGPGCYFAVKNCQMYDPPYNGFKSEGGHHIDVDNIYVTRVRTTGAASCVLFDTYQGVNSHHWQLWNSVLDNAGYETTTANYGHGLYTARFDNTCVAANLLITDPHAFGMQIYPGPGDGLVCTGITMIRGLNRGGLTIGTDGVANKIINCKFVGLVCLDADTALAEVRDSPLAANNRLVGAVEWGSGGSNYQIAGLAPVAHIVANPLLDANYRPASNSPVKGIVPQSHWGYLPATDKDGNPRLTADAGCYRVL